MVRRLSFGKALDRALKRHNDAVVKTLCKACLGTTWLYVKQADGTHQRVKCQLCENTGRVPCDG